MPQIRGHASYSTIAKFLKHSFKKAIYEIENPKDPTPAMMLGSAAECLTVHGREVFDSEYLICPFEDARKKDYKDFVKDHVDDKRIILKPQAERDCIGMSEALHGEPMFENILKGAEFQHKVEFDFEGVELWGYIDVLNVEQGIIGEVKSSAAFNDFFKMVAMSKYHIQAFIYKRSCLEKFGREFEYRWFVMDSGAPYDVKVFNPSDMMLERAKAETMQGLGLFLDWQTSDFKKHRQTEPEIIDLPGYY